MSIEITIDNIDDSNKREKIINLSKALSLALNISIDVNGDGILEKSKLHKYISKEFVNSKWYYKYEENKKSIEDKVAVCSSQPLKVTPENAKRVGEQFLRQWKKDWQENPKKRECPALNYTKIGFDDISIKHLSVKGKNIPRKKSDLVERASLLPFAKEILEGKNKGSVYTVRSDDKQGLVYYEILGQAIINGKKETISVIISKIKPDTKKYISVIKKALTKLGLNAPLSRQDASMLQSISTTDYHATSSIVTENKNKSNRLISVIRKAISKLFHRDSLKNWYAMDGGGQCYINRKSGQAMQTEGETSSLQVGSSLPNIASYNNQSVTNDTLPSMSENIKRYPNIILEINNVTKENRFDKFTKAIKAVAEQLDLPVGVETVEKQKTKCIYPIQEELLNYWTLFYKKLLNELYLSIVSIFDLPSINVESLKKSNNFIMQKANEINKIKPLMYNGKILYNMDTGKPIDKKDFDAFIKAIEAFLNQNTKDVSKHITLDSVAISKILKRLAKYSTTKKMQELNLNDLKFREKTFDWIREDYKNLNNVLGYPISHNEMARYQVCEDTATKLITRVNEDVRLDIKNTFLDGIKNQKSKTQISQELFDKFGHHNRDWKRIVETETVNISNLASILEDVQNAEEGEKVYFKRYEAGDACPICQSIDGIIALWVNTPLPDDKIDDEYASIALWEGKESNSKLGIVGTGTMHPHCRGAWIKWDTVSFDATVAKINGKEEEWNNAVEAVKEEYKQKSTNPPDKNSFVFRMKVQDKYRLASS